MRPHYGGLMRHWPRHGQIRFRPGRSSGLCRLQFRWLFIPPTLARLGGSRGLRLSFPPRVAIDCRTARLDCGATRAAPESPLSMRVSLDPRLAFAYEGIVA